ncbi:ribonuclease HI family protein [Candidatus Berkelbacteria bacterium]|nr:ribonuclease HI family protein [Candidatus Berkelbacteria bacterium]
MPDFLTYTDGGARGNPGPAGAGVVVQDGAGNTLAELAKPLGQMTNNQAEYWGLIFALEQVRELATVQGLSAPSVTCYLDSELIVQQMNGLYKIKNEGLKPLYGRVRELVMTLGGTVTFSHIPRRQNKRADELSNDAMDIVESKRT